MLSLEELFLGDPQSETSAVTSGGERRYIRAFSVVVIKVKGP